MKTMKKILNILVLVTSMTLLVACGGDGIGGTGVQLLVGTELTEKISRVSIPFREHGYSNFDTTVITSKVEFEQFISEVNAQNGWNNKASFLRIIQDERTDFTVKNLILYRLTESSGSNVLTPHEPSLQNSDIGIIIDRSVPQTGTADVAYYVLAYKINKSVTKVVFEVDGKETIINPSASTVSTAQGKLIRSNKPDLLSYFKDSVIQRKTNTTGASANTRGEVASIQNSSFVADSFSSTNIQESGVDEADLIKTDGRYIYSVKKFEVIYSKPFSNGDAQASIVAPDDKRPQVADKIRIMDTKSSKGLVEVKSLSGGDDAGSISGLYLHQDEKRLIALSSANRGFYRNWFNSQFFSKQKTQVNFIDVTKPAMATIDSTIKLEGSLVSSRRKGDTLYMVLRHYPDYQYVDNDALQNTAVEKFLPTYQVDDGTSLPLVRPQDCFLEDGQRGSSDIITLVAINLKSETPKINTQCYVGNVEAIYASQEALYLATTRRGYQTQGDIATYRSNQVTTDIHKFAFNNMDFDYRGSGEVDGHLGFKQSSKSFRFSEKQGELRVITFDEDLWGSIEPRILPADGEITAQTATIEKTSPPLVAIKSPVLLSILKENLTDKSLQLVSKLPNKSRPDPIGLPGEKLYATRFIGNRAYIVTFRVIDPLYVLDLSHSADPFIAGELKVEGYSDYLHPITDTLLLGVGKDAIPDGGAGSGDGRGAWYQGVKLSLIDVSDPANPREADKLVLGKRGTESTVLNNHHAFTSLKMDDSYRVALPIRLHEDESPLFDGGNNPSRHQAFQHTGLYRYEIDIDNQKIKSVSSPITTGEKGIRTNTSNISNDRSIITSDNIYYMHGGNFWTQDWSGNGKVQGPK